MDQEQMGPAPPVRRHSPIREALDFLKVHPVLCLLLLSPGIPEYLSSSSPLNAIVLQPFQFVFQLSLNLGLYGPGVLLIREAKIRWKKGWASVLFLGAAYAILEEGIAVSTLFNPQASPVGALGYFGRWLGVNWIWAAGVISVHLIYSISLPIMLLGLALPATKEKSFLSSSKKISLVYGILGVDVLVLLLVVLRGEHFWMGGPLFLESLLAIGVLIYLARKMPARAIHPFTYTPLRGPRTLGIVGLLFYPSILFLEFGGMHEGLPAPLVLFLVVLDQALFLIFVIRTIGKRSNERHLIALGLGLIFPIAVFGVIATIALPVALVADVAMLLFFRKLWRNYAARPVGIPSSEELENSARGEIKS